jgi:hypothetical protein
MLNAMKMVASARIFTFWTLLLCSVIFSLRQHYLDQVLWVDSVQPPSQPGRGPAPLKPMKGNCYLCVYLLFLGIAQKPRQDAVDNHEATAQENGHFGNREKMAE